MRVIVVSTTSAVTAIKNTGKMSVMTDTLSQYDSRVTQLAFSSEVRKVYTGNCSSSCETRSSIKASYSSERYSYRADPSKVRYTCVTGTKDANAPSEDAGRYTTSESGCPSAPGSPSCENRSGLSAIPVTVSVTDMPNNVSSAVSPTA